MRFLYSWTVVRRPIEAMKPFRFIGKEIERKAQEGEEISVIESTGPIRYEPRQTAKHACRRSAINCESEAFSGLPAQT